MDNQEEQLRREVLESIQDVIDIIDSAMATSRALLEEVENAFPSEKTS